MGIVDWTEIWRKKAFRFKRERDRYREVLGPLAHMADELREDGPRSPDPGYVMVPRWMLLNARDALNRTNG